MADDSGKTTQVFENGWIGKLLLAVVDKLFLAAVVIALLKPMEAGMQRVQQRHDKATQIGDLLVDNALASLGRLTNGVAEYTAAIQFLTRGGAVDAGRLVELRTKIDTEINILRSYVGTDAVKTTGNELATAIQLLNNKALTKQLEQPDVPARVEEVTTKAYAFTKAVVEECRNVVQRNIDAAYN
jgi:hypothetical protein